MKLQWTKFTGIRPRADVRLLPDGNAQVAQNIYTDRGGVRPLRGNRDIMPLAKSGVRTIYRFAQSLPYETQYWFHWTTDVDVVKGPIANDTNERTYWTGDGAPKYTTNALGTAGSNLPSGWRPLGVPGPTNPPTLGASGTVTGGKETRVYIYTFVTDMGEESEPSPAGTITMQVGQAVNLSSMQTATSNSAVLTSKRIYRAQQGRYLFVAEIPASSTTYSDSLASDSLGEACPSVGWNVPPATMFGLVGGPNGVMAAIDGYTVRFCEPYRPHAWPSRYSQTVSYPTVAIAQFANSYLVLTAGFPYRIDGVTPGSMSMTAQSFYQPCVSKRSVVSIGTDVIWASPDGLVSTGAGGDQVLTESLFTAEDWLALNPSSMIGEWHEGYYVGFYTVGGTTRGFMLHFATQQWVDLPSIAATAMYRDTIGDALFLCVGDRIQKFRAGTYLSYTWKSQEVVTPLSDFVAARVTGDYPVTFKLYKNKALRHTKVVQSDEPFKLPPGLCRQWEIELSGTNAVLGVVLSSAEGDI